MLIEQTVIEYLTDNSSVPVYAEVPEDPPAQYLVVEKTGSGQTNHISTATLAVQSYADSLFDAATLSHETCNLLWEMASLTSISRVDVTDYNFTDTQSKKYRYQAVLDVVYYDD
jgi:hypothetical protein